MNALRLKELGRSGTPLLLGTVAFFLVVGPRVLDPTNIGWLSEGDPPTGYLGWQVFRNSEWSFPVGLNPNYGLEIGSAIPFTDSNPLLAILFKPLAAVLPEPFQYFGLWLYACFVLQAWFAWKLVGLASDHPVLRLLATGLFVFSPPMIWRVQGGHLNLAGHFLIVAGLYLSLLPTQRRRAVSWIVLLVTAALVHAYLLAMVAVLWLADWARRAVANNRRFGCAAQEFLGAVFAVGLSCWQAGYFAVGSGVSSGGYGLYKLDLLAPLDASGWSYVLQDVPDAEGEYEGFNFLGLGVICLALFATPALLAGRARISPAIRNKATLLAALVGLTMFALSNKLGVGPAQFELALPDSLFRVANVFRASGRMFWPFFYALLFVIVFAAIRGNSVRVAASLLAIALVAQVADMSVAWQGIRKKLMTKPEAEWVTPLKDTFWTEASSRYRKVRWLPPQSLSPHWQTFAAYAGRHRLATDAVYVNRVNEEALEAARAKALTALNTGQFEPDSLYILDEGSLRAAILHRDQTRDLLVRVDGFNVLAPRWKECDGCTRFEHEVSEGDLFPPIKLGERILFSKSGSGFAYLADGWSQPEPWGIWSDGSKANVVLPIQAGSPHKILIEANALVSTVYPRQHVEIRINGVLAAALSLAERAGNRIEVPISELARQGLKERGHLLVEFRFSAPVRPKDLGLGYDSRRLALGLLAITVI